MATDVSQLDIPFMMTQKIKEMSNLLCQDEDNSDSNQSLGLDEVGYQNLQNAMEA